jgi:hypothetical protein
MKHSASLTRHSERSESRRAGRTESKGVLFCISFALLFATTAALAQTVYNTTGTFTRIIPATGTYTITAVGADGGDIFNSALQGGTGASVQATFTLNVGDMLTIFVGNSGEDGLIDARASGGGGGGTAVILNSTDVLIAAGGGGGASRFLIGFGGVANTNSIAGAGASPEGGGGGGFNATAPNPTIGCTSTQGGRQGTLTVIGALADGTTVSCTFSGGDGGQGFGGGGGANFQTGGGGGGHKGGDGGANSSDGGDGGDSFVNTGVRDGTVISATAGTNGGSTSDADGSVTFSPAIIQGEANVQGNGISISDGDSSPSSADHSYFGVVPNGSSVNRTFTIQNLHASENLSVGAISMTGTNAAEFSISGITFPVTLAPSGSTTFVVTLNSSSSSIRTAKVNITNSDLDEFIYDFTVQGNSNPPTVTYTPLTNAGSTSNRVLTGFATITDDFGVSVGASLPRLYFKKSTDANAFVGNTSTDNGWKYVIASNSTSPFDFTIDYAILLGGSAATNDVIQYFVVAQDDENQLTSLATGATASGNPPVQNINSAATTPNSYTILSPISGVVTVGSGGTYPNLTGASGLFADINGPGLNGNLTATIISDLTEDGTNALNQWTETGGSNYTLTIQPDAATMRTISGDVAVTNGMIRLDGADRVRIDGRFNGAGRYLTFSNTNTGQPTITFINDATNDSLRNCIVQGVNISNGVVYFGTTTGTTGNDNILIDSCDVRDGVTLPTNGLYSNGATGTSAQFNSGNTVSNCNIFDYYSTSASNGWGLRFDNGNSGWTITGNSFYQTVSRAAVASSVFGIGVFSGDDFTITNNFIGGSAPSAGGTAWTTTGTTVAHRFVGMQLNVGTTTPSSVQGNTIKNFVWTSSSNAATLPGVWCGIYVQAGSANIGTTAGNTIGSGTGTGSVSVTTAGTGGATFGIGAAGSDTRVISNNIIGSITTNGSATTISASLIGIQVTAGTNTISGNTVGSTTTANSLNASNSSTSTTGQAMTGIQSSSTGGATITNNTVANLNNNYAGAGTAGQIRGIVTSSGSNTITGNTVRNLSTTSLNANAATLQSVYGIIQTSTVAGQTVSQNVVHSLSNTAASAAVSVTGIYFAGSTTTAGTISRNLVHSLSVSSTSATSVMNGMQFVGGTFTAQNNMVRVGIAASGTSTAGASIIRGIYDNGTTANRNFYHNSAYVGGTQTSLAANTFAFTGIAGVSNVRAYQNNIFVNARSNSSGTGKHYAVQYGGTAVNPTGLTATNNIFLVSGTGGVLGLYNSVDQTTLAAWQSATGRDAASINVSPLFVNPTGTSATVDLHLQNNTPAEASGVVVATMTDDYDGETRSNLTPVDIGADAGNFGLGMSYTLLTNGSTANRTATNFATISSVNGVSGGANLPRFYFRKSTDADAFVGNTSADNGWKYVLAGNSTSPYSFTIDYSIINGGSVIVGDVIQYFVVAQDDANNFRSSPLGASFSANPPVQNVNAKPTAGVNSYTILATLSGARTVGAAGDYLTLTGAGGLFAAINNSILIGNLTITITGDLTEDGTTGLNQWLEEGGGSNPAPYSVTIQPADATMKIISGAVANSLIRLNGSDRVTIDGRFAGAGRFFTFRNTTAGQPTILFINDASNNTVRNSIIEGAVSGGTNGVVFISTGVTTGNDNNTITDNRIRDRSDADGVPFTLLYAQGSSSSVANSNNTVSNNEVLNFVTYGIYCGSDASNENWTVTGNEIYQTVQRTSGMVGIYFNGGGSSLISENKIHDLNSTLGVTGIAVQQLTGNVTVSRNRLYSFPSSSGNMNRITGISFNGQSAGHNLTIANNQISIIPSFTNDQLVTGIWDRGLAGSTCNVYYNNVFIGGTATGATSATWAFLRDIPSTSAVRNNIFFNNRMGGTANHYAAGNQLTTGSLSINYNLFVGTGTTSANFFDVNNGLSSTGTPASFATWQAAQRDTFSYATVAANISAANLFVDPATGNLNINTANAESWYANGKGVAGSSSGSIADDYGATNVRGVIFGTPTDIGADEFTPSVTPSCAIESAPPAVNTTTTYTYAGRTVATIAWGAGGTPPTSVCFQHFSGNLPPPFITGQPNFIRSYWEITATGGTGYTYGITLYYTEGEINAIGELNLGVAKRDGGNPWVNVGGAPDMNNNAVFIGGLNSFSQFTLNDQTSPLPVQLASFTGAFVGSSVRLNWRTLSEINNYGFFVQNRRTGEGENGRWGEVANSFVPGHGTTNEPHDYSFTHANVGGGAWQYRLKQVDLDGTEHFTEPITVSSPTSVKEVAPIEFALKQNYPNPFNPETNIKFSVEETGRATLEVFNMLGQKVATLFDDVVEAGYYETVKLNGSSLASGIYFYRLQSWEKSDLKKLLLLK